MFPNQDLGIHVLVANFKTKVRVAVLYAKPGTSDDDITDAIDESLDKVSSLASISSIPWEKTSLRMAYPPEDDDPRLECGPDPWNFAAQIDWEGDDDGYPMQHGK
ncbi:ATP-dependent DNA helicase [Caerostris extrusa]|uniref:ATP-dependent DNA helicase n=1 Tax=Caerostris extrusa TaxID=172846 RepID=A0AAV4Y8A1_CAEEX|nr:ATP-dependent DNA helicase [Caerostris extrusa]